MAQTSLSFLVNPNKAQALASSVTIERRPAQVAYILILFLSAAAICFTATALVSRPLEGFLNLGELLLAALVGRSMLRKLNRERRLSDRLKRLSVIVSSIAVVWISAAALLLSLCVVLKLNLTGFGPGAIAVELAFWVGMLAHAFRTVSRVATFIADNAPVHPPS